MFHPRGLGILCNCAPIIIKRLTVKIIKIDKNRHKEVIVCDNCQLNTNTKLIKKKKKSYWSSSIGYMYLARLYLHFLLLLCQFKDPGLIQTSSQVRLSLICPC